MCKNFLQLSLSSLRIFDELIIIIIIIIVIIIGDFYELSTGSIIVAMSKI